MTRRRLLITAAALGLSGLACLIAGIILLPNIRSYVDHHYQRYAPGQYTCSGSPQNVADNIANAQSPSARGGAGGTYYLRYSDSIVTVGPHGGHPCTVRVEDLSAGYNHGSYIFLGPGFTPGSPSSSSGGHSGGGSGGGSGGPGGVK
ncbi:hypothetical protein ABIA30_000191 [Mycobacterium sp. MAA66]|uniref:DUF4247 domain-containing protein n=1 Tax=Mycobacterium sp. MAA66 TaxID=3156297 RepID=UPI0035164B35